MRGLRRHPDREPASRPHELFAQLDDTIERDPFLRVPEEMSERAGSEAGRWAAIRPRLEQVREVLASDYDPDRIRAHDGTVDGRAQRALARLIESAHDILTERLGPDVGVEQVAASVDAYLEDRLARG